MKKRLTRTRKLELNKKTLRHISDELVGKAAIQIEERRKKEDSARRRRKRPKLQLVKDED